MKNRRLLVGLLVAVVTMCTASFATERAKRIRIYGRPGVPITFVSHTDPDGNTSLVIRGLDHQCVRIRNHTSLPLPTISIGSQNGATVFTYTPNSNPTDPVGGCNTAFNPQASMPYPNYWWCEYDPTSGCWMIDCGTPGGPEGPGGGPDPTPPSEPIPIEPDPWGDIDIQKNCCGPGEDPSSVNCKWCI